MVRFFLLAFVVAAHAAGDPVACVPGPVEDYVALGSAGCLTPTGSVLSDFSLAATGPADLDLSQVTIVPTPTGLDSGWTLHGLVMTVPESAVGQPAEGLQLSLSVRLTADRLLTRSPAAGWFISGPRPDTSQTTIDVDGTRVWDLSHTWVYGFYGPVPSGTSILYSLDYQFPYFGAAELEIVVASVPEPRTIIPMTAAIVWGMARKRKAHRA